MKKISLFFLIISAVILLAGCGTQTPASVTPAGSAGVIETNPADDTARGDLNPIDDLTASTTSAVQTTNPISNMPTMIIDQSKTYTAILHTDQGDITVALNAKATPLTVNNFVWLAKKSFYDNTIFHRVIKDFMIQGGDPKGDGTGGPGYQFADEKFTGDYTRGTLAMANAGPNTNGSQFFIMHADVPLQKDYVIFGHVTKGLEVVDKIATAETTRGADGAMSKPVTPVKVNSIEIIEK